MGIIKHIFETVGLIGGSLLLLASIVGSVILVAVSISVIARNFADEHRRPRED